MVLPHHSAYIRFYPIIYPSEQLCRVKKCYSFQARCSMIASRQHAVDTAQQQLVSYCGSQLQATARVRLDCLTFPDDIPHRIDDGRNTLRLQQVMGIQGCLRLNPQYRVKVHVDAADWEQRLTLQSQAEHLPELYVPLDHQLIGHNNYSIITAAKTLLANPHRWWVVDIYLTSESGMCIRTRRIKG